MRLTKAEKKVILECVEIAWNHGIDRPLYEDCFDKEVIRRDLIKKFTKELNEDE